MSFDLNIQIDLDAADSGIWLSYAIFYWVNIRHYRMPAI